MADFFFLTVEFIIIAVAVRVRRTRENKKLNLQPGTATAIIMNSTVRKKKSAIADAQDSSFCRPRVLDFLSFSQLSSSYHPYLRTRIGNLMLLKIESGIW